MKHYSKLFKRVQAWVLTVAMLLPLVNSGLLLGISAADETLPVRDKVVTTEGKIVADNYELSEAEEALLASGLLAGVTHTVAVPNEGDELVSVNQDTHAIKAVEWTDANGYVWKPVAVRIMVGEDEKETVTLTNGEGTYVYDGNAFSVHVDYEVCVDVSVDTQTKLWNAAANLKDGLAYLDRVNEANVVISEIASDEPRYDVDGDGDLDGNDWTVMDVLEALANATFPVRFTSGLEFSLGFANDDAKAAVAALREQMNRNKANGLEETFDLCLDVDAYGKSASKLQYLVNSGARLNENFRTTYEQIQATLTGLKDFATTIRGLGSNVDMTPLESLESFQEILQTWLDATKKVYNAETWVADTTDIVRTDLTADQWAKLDSLVSAIDIMTPAPAEFKTSLLAGTTTIKHNMQMYDVAVTVNLKVADIEDGSKLALYAETKTATVTLAKDATKDEIIAAIAATGVEDAAINAWLEAGVYVAGQFDTRDVLGLPEALTDDANVSITYSPNLYTVTYDYEGGGEKNLYYGARTYLPLHADPAQSYDYLVDGDKYYQGEWVTVTGDTRITRTEGKAYVGTPLNQLVSSVIFADNKNAAAILNSGALTIGNEKQMIRYPDASCVELKDNVLTATAYSSGYQDLNWVPATYTIINNGDTPVTKDYEGPVTLAVGTYDRVTVSFKLDLPETGVLDLVTLPYDLWIDVQDQQAAMNKLSAQKDNLGLLKRSLVGMIKNSLGDSTEDKALAAIFDRMLNDPKCMGTDAFVLYELLEDYDGMAYYYANNVKFRETVSILEEYLTEIVEYKTALSNLLNNFSDLLPSGKTPDEILSKIDTLKNTMEQLSSELKPVDSRVDVSKDLDVLLNALGAKTNPFTSYTEAPDFYLTEEFSVDAPDKTSVKVTLTGGGLKDVTVSKLFSYDPENPTVLTEQDVAAIKALVEAALAERVVDNFFYTNDYADLDWNALVGETLTQEGISLTVTWTTKTFNVVVGGQTQTITFIDRVVNLPASTDPDFRYDYYLGDQKLNVVDGKYTFTGVEDAFKELFADGSCEITLDPVNIADELAAAMDAELLSFVNGLNDSIGDGGMSFALVKNNGKYSVIMKIDGSQPNALAGAVQGLAMGFVTSGYSTIAMDNKGVFADSQISLQALIDAIMNSGFSTNDLIKAVDADGNIIEFNLPGTVLTGDKALGGKLITTTMQLTKGDTTREMDFYITLSSASAEITQIRNLMAGQLKGYFSIDFANGKSTVNLTIPEKAYEAYLAGLLVTGYLDIRDINAMEAQIAGKFMFDVVHPLFGKDSDIDTLKNTLKLFGFQPDLSRDELSTLFNMVRDRHENVYTSITFDETTGEITKTISIKGLLGSMNLPENLTGFIKEYDTGITITGATAFPQMGRDYEAAYVDVRAENKLDMIGLIKKGQLANKKLSGASIVVLLDNITGNLTFDKTTVLNLNGFTVNGNVTSTGNLTIVDSCLEQNGSVTGTVSGNVTALSGRYTYSLDADMLKSGYEQDSFGVVHNKFYNFVKDGEGNITIEVNAGLLNLSHYDGEIPDVKFMVLDLAVDMFFNGYTTNHLEIDGNLVYNLCVDDFVALYTGDRKQELIEDVRNMFDAQAIVNIMNLIIDDVTDFDALYEALANDQPLFSYDMTTGSWKIVTGRVDNNGNDYFTIGIGSGDTELGEYKTRKLNVKIVGSDEDKQHLLDILEQFRDTTDIDINLRPVEGGYDAADKDLVLGWGGSGSVLVDFTKNDNYAVLFGVLLADGLKGTATSDKLVAAIREYYETDNIYALKVAFNAVTVSQLMDTFMDYNRSSDVKKMINALGLADVVSDEVNELEDLFDRYAKVLTAVSRRIDNRFDLPESGRTLGSFFNATLGGYGFSRDNIVKNVKRDVLRGFGVDLTAKVDHVSVIIRIFADDLPPVEDEIDYSKLEAAITAAEALFEHEAEYTAETWAYMMAKYNAALDARNSLDQEEVDAAAEALLEAIQKLEKAATPDPEIDYEKLEAAIKAAEELFAHEAEYTTDSWKNMMDAYEAAVAARESKDQAEVDAAADALLQAIEDLDRVPEDELDYSELKDKIDEAEAKVESEYTPDSWTAMQTVLAEAKAMYEGKTAENQDQIDAMVAKLDEAIDALILAGGSGEDELDYSALQDKINEAEALNKSTYTADSWTAMQAVLAEAKDMFENKTAETQDEIDAMVAELAEAINNLVVAGGSEDDDEYDPEDYPDGAVEFNKDTHTNVAGIYKKGNVYVADAHHATGMTVGAFLEILRAVYTDYTVKAFKADGTTEITDMDSLLFTGAVIKILDGQTVVDQFTAAVLGDLDGDGKQSAKDTYLTKWHAANDATLAEHLSAAIDYNNDGVNNAKDSYLAAYKAAHWEDYKATAES